MGMTARSLSGLASAAVVTTIFVFGIQTPSQGQAGKDRDVRVTNTTSEPVPAAIVGTPTVNIGNAPTVTIGNTPGVVIGNTGDAPALVRDVTNVPKAQVRPNFSMVMSELSLAEAVMAYTVPAGKRLVIEHVAAQVIVGHSDAVMVRVVLQDAVETTSLLVPTTPQGTAAGSDILAVSASIRIVLDAGSKVGVAGTRLALGSAPALIDGMILGYLENVP